METGVQGSLNYLRLLDSGVRRNDKKICSETFYETINVKGELRYRAELRAACPWCPGNVGPNRFSDRFLVEIVFHAVPKGCDPRHYRYLDGVRIHLNAGFPVSKSVYHSQFGVRP